MAAIVRMHAFFRPLKNKGTVIFFRFNKLHISQPKTKNALLHKRLLYPRTALRFQSTNLDTHNLMKNSTDITQTVPKLSPETLQAASPIINSEEISSIADHSSTVTENAITTLASQGLGGWWPPGLAQEYVNMLHTSLDMPWWLAICTGTLIIRICLFPLIIKGQKYTAHMSNHMPQLQLLQFKMTEARKSGNPMETARYANEMAQFVKEKNFNPLKPMIVPLVSAPIFISFFLGLRRMASLPMESMKDGGILWFQNLTIPDPLYILPLITSATFYLTIHFAVDGIQTNQTQIMHYFLRAMPLIMLPFIIYFPSAVLCYWVSTNSISLLQVIVLKVPAVRKYFDLPTPIKHNPNDLPMKPKGFVEGFKDTWKNSKITNELENRQRLNDEQFRKAGTGPIPKTYKYDPTRQRAVDSRKSVMAKKNEK